jgi:hypothetical protein
MSRLPSLASLACFLLAGALGIVSLLTVTPALAQPKVDAFVSGLHLPLGITTDYTRKAIYVAEGGEGRVIQIDSGKPVPVIVGFPRGPYGPNNSLQVGPSSIRVVGNLSLASIDVGAPQGWDSVVVHSLPESGKPAVEYATSTARLGPMAPRTASRPAGSFSALGTAVYSMVFTSVGDEPQGLLYRALMTNNKWNAATRFVATREAVGAGNPSAILTTSRGEVLVGQSGSLRSAGR